MTSRAVFSLPRHTLKPYRSAFSHIRPFHSTSVFHNSSLPDHYATLDLPTTATAPEVKKQFYKLSKENHPDLRPNDPEAAKRFVHISNAYATLGSPEKRASYDRDFLRTQPSARTSYPSGSFSSASTPAGGRPASGLSRRRTQFRGPPPSFYASGGWGKHEAKRSEYAENARKSAESQEAPGTGPGGFAAGRDNDVPHFDRDGHLRRHSGIEQTRHKARRKPGSTTISEEELAASQGNSALFNFVMMSGVLATIWGISAFLMSF